MSSNSNSNLRISNEQLLLINILNTMYNDNRQLINNITETLNNLINSNNQIRELLVQLLSSNYSSNNNRRQGFSERRNRENNNNRVFLNNRPYVIDSVTEYTIPRHLFSSFSNLTSNNNNNNNNNDNRSSRYENAFTQLFQNFLQPVEVFPTQSQIESATRNVRYCDISRPVNTQCPISMEDFNDSDMVTVIRHCGHIFNSEHIMNWFRSNCRCPVCRYDIRDYNSNASTEFFNSNNNNTNINNNNTNNINTINENTNLAGRNLSRTNSINSAGNNSRNVFDDLLLNNINLNDINNMNFTDASGNHLDNSNLAMFLINAFSNRSAR